MSCPPRLPMPRSPRAGLPLTWMTSPWSTSVSTPLLRSLRSAPRTSTRFSVSGSPRLPISLLRLEHPRMRAVTTALSCSASRPPSRSPLSSSMLSRGRTRTSLMRSRTSLTSLVRVAAPSTLLTNSAVCLSRRRRSSRPLLRRLRPLLRWRRTECSAPSLSSPMSGRRLTGVWPRRRRSSTTPGRTTPAPWSPWEPPLRPSMAKGEGLRIKKQLEGEINELEIGLDHANKANSEGLKSIKRYQTQLRETIQLFEDEARSKAQIIEQVGISERKSAALSGEVEESKALLDGANRAIRQLQTDISDARGAVNNMQTINGRDMTSKRKLESSIHTLQAEVDGMLVAAKNGEEKAKKAMVDAARLADELRAEQEHVAALSTGKNSLNNALGELEGRLSDAENAALKGGKTAMAKLEGKIRELEAELASTQSRTGEASKAFQRAERKAKELAFAQGEDKKNQDRMSELASKLQNKIKTYKQQIEEAEEIAALNLAKFRKAQQELEETEDRAKMAENSISDVSMTRSFF